MSGESNVDRAAMAQAAQRLEDAVGTTRSIRTQLQGHRGEVLSSWSGNAARAFETVFEQFDQDFQRVITAMDGMHGKLVQTQATYVRTEEEQTANVNRISNVINQQ